MRESGTDVEAKMSSGSVFDELVTAVIKAKARTLIVGAVVMASPAVARQRGRAHSGDVANSKPRCAAGRDSVDGCAASTA